MFISRKACNLVSCPIPDVPKGACCDRLTGLCTDGRIEADCLTTVVKPFWFSGDLCQDVDCLPAIGACCDSGSGVPGAATCEQTTFADCNCDTCTWFKGQDCSALKTDNRCLVNPIPAVTEWGLVILTPLLLTGAKVGFGRRPGDRPVRGPGGDHLLSAGS